MLNIVLFLHGDFKKVENLLITFMNQTNKNFKLIIVPTVNSTNIKKICDFYTKKNEEMLLVSQQHFNLYIAKKAALALCSNEYTLFINDDILITKNFISDILKQINNDDCYLINNNAFYFEYFVKNNIFNQNTIFNKIIKTEIFDSIVLGRNFIDNLTSIDVKTSKDINLEIDNLYYSFLNKDVIYDLFLLNLNNFKKANTPKNLKAFIKSGIKAYYFLLLNEKENVSKLNSIKSSFIFLDKDIKCNNVFFKKIKNGNLKTDSFSFLIFKLFFNIKSYILSKINTIKSNRMIKKESKKKRKVQK